MAVANGNVLAKRTLIYNIGQLLTMRSAAPGPLRGPDMKSYEVLPDAALLMEDCVIREIGESASMYAVHAATCICVDAGGRIVTPGLVDAHTHLVHGGSREHELAQKIAGVPYLEILAQGGGILSTVEHTRRASVTELVQKAASSLRIMLAHGVTTVEAKSGYGLDWETERKQLEAVRMLQISQPVSLVSTFLAAHAIPPEYKGRSDAYIDLVIGMLPQVAACRLAEFCDVFCEAGVFSVEQSRRLFASAREAGLIPKIHADEIEALGGTELACQVGAASADHLLAITPHGLAALRESEVIPVVLPGTAWNLGKTPAPARMMIDDYRLPIAVATDYNPGSCPTENLQLVMAFATHTMKLAPLEVFAAVTRNAAHAIRRQQAAGMLDVGRPADVVLWNAPNPESVVYHFGINHVDQVWISGRRVVNGGIALC